MNELNLINEKEIIMQDGIICMNAESIGRALGYSEPRIASIKSIIEIKTNWIIIQS